MSIYDKSSLVLIPSGTKTGKIFSQKPVSGDGDFTFTRASAATRVNADGNIEKETGNLLLQSNTFSTTWGNSNTTETSGQSGYDGTNDAWLLTSTTGGGAIGQSISSSGVQTFSVYAKSGTLNWMAFTISGLSPSQAYFDLQNGALGSSGSEIITSNIESVGGGWYRCSVLVNGAVSGVNIYPANANNQVSVLGSIYIQDAQLNQGLIAQEVITTTTTALYGGITDNTPRLDYTDSSCPALLLEPLRTNQMRYSEYQSGGGFNLGANITWNGFVESPEGVTNASRFTSNSSGSSYVQAIDIVIPSGDFTYSMWVRGISGSFSNTALYIPAGIGSVYMNEIPVAGEDWKLVYGTGNNSGSAVTRQITLPFYDQPAGVVWEMYGFQLEAGSYATSYIPTYGSSVSRVAEASYATGASDVIGQTEGTLFVEYDQNLIGQAATRRIMALSNGTTSNRIVVYVSSSNKIDFYVRNSSGQLFLGTSANFNTKGMHKIAAAYKNGDYVVYLDGTQIISGAGTAGTIPACNRIDLGNQMGANDLFEPVYQAMLFKTRLSNEELAALTTI